MEPEGTSAFSVFVFIAGFVVYLLLIVGFRQNSPLMRALPFSLRFRFLPSINNEYLPFLIRNFPFYNRLDDRHRRIFEGRVQKFIDDKEFIPRGGFPKVSAEMKALIAGSAIQLTFGYPNIYFRHFEKILIYPDDYYSTITRNYHKGEVNRGGIIVLSWSNLKESFNNPSDGIHLGFHEMAHALRLINIVDNEEYDFYDRDLMLHFDMEAYKEIDRIIDTEQPSLFRSYGATNTDEFFAVAVEVFFEQTDIFYSFNPELFMLLATILRLDPRSGREINLWNR